MSGECNYCGGQHAEAECDADREIVYNNGASYGHAVGHNEQEDARSYLATRLAESEAAFGEAKAEIERLKADAAKSRQGIESLKAELSSREDELLRVRTAGHGAAHELDNIAIELGMGHSPKPGDVAERVRAMETAQADAAKWKWLYEMAMRECQFHRDRVDGIIRFRGLWRYQLFNTPDPGMSVRFMNDHDTARREAGLGEK